MKKEETLVRKGILDLKPYIPGKPIEEVQQELGLEEVIKLASNETSIGPSPLALEAIKKEIKNINLYPEGSSMVLREKLAHKLSLDPDMIIVGNGADNIIDLVGMAFINEGDEVIAGEVTFPAYETITTIMGGKFLPVKLKDYSLDLEEMSRCLNERTKLIFLCNPNNPTGTMVDKEAVDNFLKQVPGEVIIVFDEAYCDYVEDPAYPDSLSYIREGRKVITLRTFSKIAGIAGLRVGYGIANAELISYLRRVVDPFPTNRLAQVAAAASLDDQEHRKKVLQTNQEGKIYLYKELKALGLFYLPTETNFIFIDLKRDSTTVFNELLKKGVIVRPGGMYGCPTFVRVTIGTAYENQKFIGVLQVVMNKK